MGTLAEPPLGKAATIRLPEDCTFESDGLVTTVALSEASVLAMLRWLALVRQYHVGVGLPDAARIGCVVLVDEAYLHFADSASPATDLVAAGKDVIVLQTFSKLYGKLGSAPVPRWAGPTCSPRCAPSAG